MLLRRFNKAAAVVDRCAPRRRAYASDVRKTSLYDLHVGHGGRMVPYAGYLLPVQYADSITSSHLYTRRSCSLFDVSHMLQTKVHGAHRERFMERVCVADVQGMEMGKSALSLFIDDETGGILDDLIITKTDEDYLYMVTNAGCKQQDMKMLTEQLNSFKSSGLDASLEFLDSDAQSLLALQGPGSAAVLQPSVSIDLSRLYFMDSTTATVCGVPGCRVTRCGYTGEDGFEISVPSDRAVTVAESFVANPAVKLAGLGARDTLRLEAGMCLHGSDITSETTPVEAALVWTINPRPVVAMGANLLVSKLECAPCGRVWRFCPESAFVVGRKRRDERRFPGASVILRQLGDGVQRKRIGLVGTEPGAPPVRAGAAVLDVDGRTIGTVTSGCPSPTLSRNIAMGYVDRAHAKNGTAVLVSVRGRRVPMAVAKMPFVKTNYYAKPPGR